MVRARKRTAPRPLHKDKFEPDNAAVKTDRKSALFGDPEIQEPVDLPAVVELPRESARPARTNVVQSAAIENTSVSFTGSLLSRVRWLERGSTAVAGTAEGAPGRDRLLVYEDREGAKLIQQCVHPGKVFDLEVAIGDEPRILCASSDGQVRLYSVADSKLEVIGGFGAEPAAAVASLSRGAAASVGSEGTIAVIDIESGAALNQRTGGDGIGVRAAAQLSTDLFATAGISGFVCVWDAREAVRLPKQRLRYPMSAASLLCLDADRAQAHYVFAGTEQGEVACWDLRKEHLPVSRTAAHSGHVWDLRVMNARPGVFFTGGEDGSVLAWDYARAAGRGVGTEDYWTAEIASSDIQQLAVGRTLGVNSIDVHPRGDLVAYVTDSSTISFTLLGHGS